MLLLLLLLLVCVCMCVRVHMSVRAHLSVWRSEDNVVHPVLSICSHSHRFWLLNSVFRLVQQAPLLSPLPGSHTYFWLKLYSDFLSWAAWCYDIHSVAVGYVNYSVYHLWVSHLKKVWQESQTYSASKTLKYYTLVRRTPVLHISPVDARHSDQASGLAPLHPVTPILLLISAGFLLK